MKVVTLTLNPAIDQTVSVNNFRLDAVNRGQAMQFDPGGKGVNVASFLADAGYAVTATGFLGEENPTLFERLFARKGITDAFIRIPGHTRTGVKIVDEVQQQTTDINMLGQAPPPEAVDVLLAQLEDLAASHEWFVLTGSLPPGVPTDIYATIIQRVQARGKHVVLDTSEAALRAAAPAGPTVIKPNRLELQQLLGLEIVGLPAIDAAARQLLETGTQLVVISMGAEGALFVNRERSLLATPPQVVVKSTVGAGDAMVAGIVAGHIAGLDLEACARQATAFSVGKITRIGPHLPPPEELARYPQQVVIQQVRQA